MLGNPPLSAETKVGFRQLGPTTPVAIQRGTSGTLQLRSNFTLDGAYRVFLHRDGDPVVIGSQDQSGITTKFLETEPIAAPRRGRGRAGTPFRFQFDVPADQPTGIYECRVATRQAVSSVTHVMVTDLPTVQETTDNNDTLDSPQSVSTPVAICGVVEKGEDVDHFQFDGTKGQLITLNMFAQRVTHAVHSMQSGNGAYLMDSILTLYGPNGQILKQNDNFYGGDSLIALTLPEDGKYTVQVRDTRYLGNPKYVYCLEICSEPLLHTIYPLAAERGKALEAALVGLHLGEVQSHTIQTTPESPLGWQPFCLKTAEGESNWIQYLVSEHPQATSDGSNLAPGAAMEIGIDSGVSGRFSDPNQQHYYRIALQKGQRYEFEIYSHRIGLPLDGVIEIRDAAGKKLAEADDGNRTKDPLLTFVAPSDGQYTLVVRDLFTRGGERYQYHLSAKGVGTDFALDGEYYYMQIAAGTRMLWFVKLNRLNGFSGPVEIDIEGLPEGVSLTPVTIPSGVNHCSLILSADEKAPVDCSLVRVRGRGTIEDHSGKAVPVERYGNVMCELQNQGGGQGRWPIKTQLIGVTEPLDLLDVEASPAEITLAAGEKKEIAVKITRNKDFNEPVSLEMTLKYFTSVLGAQLPSGVQVASGSVTRIGPGKAEGKIILEALTDSKAPAPVEKLPIAVIARVGITFSITTNYASNPIYLTIPESKP